MYKNYIKYCIDVFLALCGLILLSWLYVIIIIAVKIDDPGPAFFTQKRVGKGKSYFSLYKFRTMKMSTPHDIPTHLLKNPEQYITRVGRFLRKTSLDELPQLYNILRGDMAVIGPRPALWNQYDLIEERDKYGANDIRPGLTGWAQINGRDELEIDVKAKLDGEYARQLDKDGFTGFFMDVKCFFGTIVSVLKSDGVVEGGTGEINKGKKMKFLVITNHSYMLWQFRRELIAELQNYGEVVLSMPFVGHEENFMAMGCRCIHTEVDRRGVNPVTDFRLYRKYAKILRTEKPDMVITYSIKPNIYAGCACRIFRIPYCVNIQGLGTAFQKEPIATIATMLYKTAVKKARAVFFENEVNAAEFVKRGIISADRGTVLKGAGVNLSVFRQQPYPDESKGIHFLFLGRIMKEKGVDELFVAARNIKKKYGEKVVFDLVGFFEDTYEQTVEQLVDDGVVEFHGFQTDPRPYYGMSHCVVLPSYHEGMSNVLLEAAATGRALIATDIPGCKEAVDEGINGYLCKKMDAGSLEECINHFMQAGYECRRDMGIAGRAKMEEEFSKERVVYKTVQTILNKR